MKMIIALLPSEIARLILNYLDDECFKQTYKTFLNECNYLAECKQYIDKGICLPKTIHGKTLKEYLITNNTTTISTINESTSIKLPKLKQSVSTQTKLIETKTIGIETLNNNEIYSLSNQNNNDRINIRAPMMVYCSNISTSNSIQQFDNNLTESSYSTNNNKRKYDFKSPTKITSSNTTINNNRTTTPNAVDDSSKIVETNENTFNFNQSNNSTPKKRRLLIGKNVNKVAELSISTIERQLEILTSAATESVNNESDQITNNPSTATIVDTSSNNNNNNNSILVLNDNPNVADEGLYDLNNTTITNVLQNIQNQSVYQTPGHSTNEETQSFLENFIKNNFNSNSGVTPKLTQMNYMTNTIPMYSTLTSMDSNANNTLFVQNDENTNNLTKTVNDEKLRETKLQSNSEIIVTKIPQTQADLLKVQDQLQHKIENKSSNVNSCGTIYLNPTLELSPNGTTYKMISGSLSNTFKAAKISNSQSDVNYNISSTSTSTTSSPNSNNNNKKKRIYKRGPTIRKMIEVENPTEEILKPINLFQIDDNSNTVTVVSTIPPFADSRNSKISNDLSDNIFTPPSTNDEAYNEDSRESFVRNKSSSDEAIKTRSNKSNNSSFNDSESVKSGQTRRSSRRVK